MTSKFYPCEVGFFFQAYAPFVQLTSCNCHLTQYLKNKNSIAHSSLAYLTIYKAMLKFQDCCFKDYCAVKLKFYSTYGKTRVS